jgi:hypothetical protein
VLVTVEGGREMTTPASVIRLALYDFKPEGNISYADRKRFQRR